MSLTLVDFLTEFDAFTNFKPATLAKSKSFEIELKFFLHFLKSHSDDLVESGQWACIMYVYSIKHLSGLAI